MYARPGKVEGFAVVMMLGKKLNQMNPEIHMVKGHKVRCRKRKKDQRMKIYRHSQQRLRQQSGAEIEYVNVRDESMMQHTLPPLLAAPLGRPSSMITRPNV